MKNELNWNKYKRCLAMAKWCRARYNEWVAYYRKVNEGTQHADAILLEELFEAVDAYNHCRKEECLKELAQCGAVIIRMIDFVKKEMEGK